jgi:uncharacterized protein (TIGR03083 family)
MSTPLQRPDEIVATLTTTWRSLADLGAGLTESQWKASTDLPGWSVQDTLSHVIGTERLLAGLPAPDPLRGDLPSYVHNPIGEFNEREVAARRQLPGAAVLAEWNELRAAREHELAAAGDDYFERPMDTPTGPGTMTDFLAARILDCWVHEQDIRRALDLPAPIAGPAAEHTVARLTRSLPMVVGKRASCPEGGAVTIELSEPIERRFVCEVTGGRAAVVDSPSAPALAVIAMDTECYLLLATGRRRPEDLTHRVPVTGDVELASRVIGGLNVLF